MEYESQINAALPIVSLMRIYAGSLALILFYQVLLHSIIVGISEQITTVLTI